MLTNEEKTFILKSLFEGLDSEDVSDVTQAATDLLENHDDDLDGFDRLAIKDKLFAFLKADNTSNAKKRQITRLIDKHLDNREYEVFFKYADGVRYEELLRKRAGNPNLKVAWRVRWQPQNKIK